jgi:prefoldin subunit 5
MTEAAELHRAVGELEGTVKSLNQKVDKLTEQVETLTAILNQGKGAKWLIFVLPSVIGIAGAMLGYFGVKFTIGH